jgi:hypothetical protein
VNFRLPPHRRTSVEQHEKQAFINAKAFSEQSGQLVMKITSKNTRYEQSSTSKKELE